MVRNDQKASRWHPGGVGVAGGGASWGTVDGHSMQIWEKVTPLLSPEKEAKGIGESDLELRPLGKGT